MPEPLFALGLGLLALGAGFLIRGGAQLAGRCGVAPFAVGLVALGPGLAVAGLAFNLSAALHGWPRLAVGNVVGGNVANVGLVLGMAVLVRPLTGSARLVATAIPCLFVATLLFWFLCRDSRISRVDAGVLLVTFAVVLAYLGHVARQEPDAVRTEFARWVPRVRPVWVGVLFVLLGVAGLVAGAELAVGAAGELNLGSGVKTLKLGLLAAIGTSIPGLVVVIVAAGRGKANVALAGVVGASLCNLLLVVGVAGLAAPLQLRDDRALLNEIPALALFTFLLVTPLVNGLHVDRMEGVVLLAAIGAFVAWQVMG